MMVVLRRSDINFVSKCYSVHLINIPIVSPVDVSEERKGKQGCSYA
jgi:hypothetical protein